MARRTRRILLLYWAAESKPRLAVLQHLRALRHLGPADEIIGVNAPDGAPRSLRTLRPDVVVLHTTFLGLRWTRGFEKRRERSEWLGGLDAVKVALPQDDYDHAGVLDDWLDDLGVDVVFTPLQPYAPVLYPRMSLRAEIRPALTGYVDDEAVAARQAPPIRLDRRPLHVAYRATRLPYWFGAHGQLKHRVGEAARAVAERQKLASDISTRPEDAIRGEEWLTFLASARTVVGCESGSSVLDSRGEMRAAIHQILVADPDASFEQVSARMPERWDSRRFFTISPRHLEAAATGTAQILVEGEYDGILEPGRHYLPVRRDLSDLEDALERSRDARRLQRLADAAFRDICLSGRYGYRGFAAEIDRVVTRHGAGVAQRGLARRAAGCAAVASARTDGALRSVFRRARRR